MMLTNISRTLLIVLIAGLIAMGWYAFSLTPASRSLLPDRGEAPPAATSTAPTDVSASAAVTGPAATPVYDTTEAGTFSAQKWSGFLKHTVLLAAITAAVLSVRKVIDLVKNWQRSKAAKLTASPTGRDQNWLDRREFLRLGGLVLTGGALAMVYKNITGSSEAVASGSGLSTPTKVANLPSTSQSSQLCVACPKGLTNDPYPGRCRLYVDNDNDGLCDYSIATACTSTAAGNSLPAQSNAPSEGIDSGGGSTPQQSCVACPRGLTNDPYPGRCRLYIDNDNDGFCDYSVATAACNSTSGANRPLVENYGSRRHFDSGWQDHENGWSEHGNGRHGHGNGGH